MQNVYIHLLRHSFVKQANVFFVIIIIIKKSYQHLDDVTLISTDIQEFYEVTLLNTQKSCEQKLEEVNHMAEKWEKSVSLHKSERTHSACPVEEVSLCYP